MKKVIAILLFVFLCSPNVFAEPVPFQRLDIQQFINKMVLKHQMNRFYLMELFSETHFLPELIPNMNHPFESLPWYKYRSHFLTDKRIDEGVAFWKAHQQELHEAYQKFGVPPKIIVAILGVETEYGQYLGQYRVIDSLTTLAFEYPAREKFFQEELEDYLVLCHNNELDPLSIYGSYAGAFGIPQFMPSSALNYATSLTHNGHLDIMHNAKDAIDSVANFLHAFKWEKGQPLIYAAHVRNFHKTLYFKDSSRWNTLSWKTIQKHGFYVPHTIRNDNLGVVKLQFSPHHTVYFYGLDNLYVITHYNSSILYAMVVDDLANAISEKYFQ